jgi:RNA polymerase sigma-70 factor (ECF subfamily)
MLGTYSREAKALADAPTTRASLLLRLRDARDGEAWAQFVDVYAPLVYGYLCKRGVQDADAADLTQEVLRAVAGSVGRLHYDPERGSFRAWLFTVVRNKHRNFLTRRRSHDQGSGDTAMLEQLQQQPAPTEDADNLWDREYERRLFAWAAAETQKEVQPGTWQAFWLTAVEGLSPQEAARELHLTLASVYLAKSRVMARLKGHIRRLQEEQS